MATSPLFGWEEPDDTDLVKDGAAAIRTLGNAIDTSMGDLLGGTSGQVLAKNSNTNMDFTWVTPDDANAIQNAIVDAKGDLIAATAADTPARLAVGTNGQVLTADSAEATGLKWATPAGGGGMTAIATGTLSNQGLSLTSISGSYLGLKLVLSNLTASGNYDLAIRFNGDSSSDYGKGQFRVDSTNTNNSANIGWGTAIFFNSNAITPGTVATLMLDLPFYARANTRRLGSGGAAFNNAANGKNEMFSGQFIYFSTTAITSIETLATDLSGSYTLYGVN